MSGTPVSIPIWADMATATTPLTETVDPDFVALANPSLVTITPAEYGNTTLITAKLQGRAFSSVDQAASNIVNFNMFDTLDALVAAKLITGTNVIYTSATHSSTVTLAAGDEIKSSYIRKATAKLRAGNAPGRNGDMYLGLIAPDVSHDLRAETGSGTFASTHENAAPGVYWPGTVGDYLGATWVETNRCYNAGDGAASARVFRTFILGQQALAEAVVTEPHVVATGVVADRLGRFTPLGWYGDLGWSIFRQACLYRLESTSTITLT
jgi:N4-gp56 family major capsid protein